MTYAAPTLLGPGILDADRIARTVTGLLAVQRPDGAIPWFRGGHLDPWDHVETAMALDAAGQHAHAARAYQWLARRQNADGSWCAGYVGGRVTDHGRESNFCAYPAVGVWHHYLSTSDEAFARALWPTVHRAITFVLSLELPGGEISWRREPARPQRANSAAGSTHSGAAGDVALVTGCCSVLHALRCALALADHIGKPQPDWEWAAERLTHALRSHLLHGQPGAFLNKRRYSMDWYYPVLGTVLRGEAAHARLDADWQRFVVPGLGARCVDDHPWVTGGESAELALALWAVGRDADAGRILEWTQQLRHPDGQYWTGYVYPDQAYWPEERTSWTAAAVLLGLAALGGDPATVAVFDGAALPARPGDPARPAETEKAPAGTSERLTPDAATGR